MIVCVHICGILDGQSTNGFNPVSTLLGVARGECACILGIQLIKYIGWLGSTCLEGWRSGDNFCAAAVMSSSMQ